MKRNRLALAAAGGALVLGATLGTGAGTASAGAQAWGGCARGDICVYTGPQGTGKVCAWDGDDPDWRSGAISCSWADDKGDDDKNVMSIWNRGTGGAGSYRHVKFYFSPNHGNYYGCAAQGLKDDTGPDAGARLRSHEWVTRC